MEQKNHLKRKSFKHKLKDLQKENVDLLEADLGKCEELTMSVWALRKSLPEVRTEIPGLAAKGTQAPELQKALTLEMIQTLPAIRHRTDDGCERAAAIGPLAA